MTGNWGPPGRPGPQGDPGHSGAPDLPGISSCTAITANDIKNICAVIESRLDMFVHKSYFNAWRGLWNDLKTLLPDDKLDSSNSYNLAAKHMGIGQCRIRRGASLVAWADS